MQRVAAHAEDGVERRRREAAARWLDVHGDAMYRFALLRLGDPHRAEDAVQEALLGALGAPERRGESSERTWLLGILRHKVIDAIRADARSGGAERASGAMGGAAVEGAPPGADGLRGDTGRMTAGAATEASDASAPAQAVERREALWRSIRGLPPRMREAVCLREIDGMPTETVCGILGVTRANLWTLLHRAKARLRDDLGETWFDGNDGGRVRTRRTR